MNGRERMAMAMRKQEPDRVPVMCQLALGHYFLHSGFDPVSIWHDSEVFAQALVALQRCYGFDGILVNLPGRPPHWRDLVDTAETHGGLTILRWPNGAYTTIPPDDNAHVYQADGSRFFPRFHELDPEEMFYVEPHDISGVTYPQTWAFSKQPASVISGEGFFPPWQLSTIRRVIELTAGEISVHSEIFSPLSQLMELLDYSNGLMALVDDPDKAIRILERLSLGAATLGCMQARAGIDALLISSAFAGGGFISKRFYEKFELPYLQRIVSQVKREFPELPVYVHTCGAIGDRLDLMLQTGIDGIDTLDPPPLGTVDLSEALQQVGKKVFIKGNVDPVNTVLLGRPADVYAAARERVEMAGPGGAYVLSTACSVPPGAPPENITQLRRAAE